jgi:hypothetical protein
LEIVQGAEAVFFVAAAEKDYSAIFMNKLCARAMRRSGSSKKQGRNHYAMDRFE